jgi:hypothetical protein
MSFVPELIFVFASMVALGALLLTAWWKNRHGTLQTEDPYGWLLERLVILAVLILFGCLSLITITMFPTH